jgi:hypothetical protein
VNLLLRIVRLLGGEQNPNSKSGAFQGSTSDLVDRGGALSKMIDQAGHQTNCWPAQLLRQQNSDRTPRLKAMFSRAIFAKLLLQAPRGYNCASPR